MEFRFVKEPNLPEKKVKTVLIGAKYSKILVKILENQGISVLEIPENPDIAPQTASHADMSVCHLGGNRLAAAGAVYDKLKASAPHGLELIKAAKPQKADYPHDIGLNACILGNRLLHNLKHTDPVIISDADFSGLECHNVRQGYTKCSVCVLKRDRIITSDMGIHSLAGRLGIESLLIKSGHIRLEGYDTGFIGGCCGKLSEGIIAFTGRLHEHPDEKKILAFIEKSNIDIMFLTDEPVFDVGSMIPIQEHSN